MPNSVIWFRRDLRLADNPALLAAVTAAGSEGVLPLFVLDPALLRDAEAPRVRYLYRSLRALDEALDGNLTVRRGRPTEEVLAAATEVGAEEVHIAADYGPYGGSRDERVEKALGDHGITAHRTGSPYAVAPGRLRKSDGTPYRVYTPFSRTWLDHGWRRPVAAPRSVHWLSGGGKVPADPGGIDLPSAGEKAAVARLEEFVEGPLRSYADDRDRPDRRGTSELSIALKYGELHPRTVLAALAEHRGAGAETFRGEICWREFFADLLFHQPSSLWEPLDRRIGRIRTDDGKDADTRFEAWAAGRTGYPLVDAGMRQLAAIGWMHNRVRMVTASFLVKDLHLPWQRGAAHFLALLLDGDYASNNHNWQWAAGTGADAAPYFRVFNPVTQSRRFDPDGVYVRRWVPELADVDPRAVHEPWKLPDGPPNGYPTPIVDHATERTEALARYEEVRR